MKRTRLLFGVLGSLVLGACAKDTPPTGSQGWEFVPGYKTGNLLLDSSKVVDTSKAYFTAAGCAYAPGSVAGGTALVQVPGHGFHRFYCQGLARDSISKITLAYHYWIRGLIAGGLSNMSSQDFLWDVQSVDVYVDIGCSDHTTVIEAHTNYRFIDDEGHVRGQGVTGATQEAKGLWCGHTMGWFARGLANGWPMNPQPPFNFDEPGNSPGAGGELPDMSNYTIISSVTISGGSTPVAIGSTSAVFTAQAYDQNGTPVAAEYTWSPGGSGFVTLDDPGVFLGQASGMAFISVTAHSSSQSVIGSATASRKIIVVEPQPVVDTLCKAVSDPTPSLPGYDPGSLPSAGPLQSLSLQDALAALPNTGTTPENGGRVWFRVSTQEYGFDPVDNLLTDVCTYYPVGGYVHGTSEGGDKIILGYAHGHPKEGTSFSSSNCPSRPGTAVLGVSDSDRVVGDSLAYYTNTNYVVQRDAADNLAIFTFGAVFNPAASPPITRVQNEHRYAKSSTSSCANRIY